MRETICTNIHNIDNHTRIYTIKIRGPIGLFSYKRAKEPKHFGLYRTTVGKVLISELGYRCELLKRITNISFTHVTIKTNVYLKQKPRDFREEKETIYSVFFIYVVHSTAQKERQTVRY